MYSFTESKEKMTLVFISKLDQHTMTTYTYTRLEVDLEQIHHSKLSQTSHLAGQGSHFLSKCEAVVFTVLLKFGNVK